MRKQSTPTADDPGLAAIDAWGAWFRAGHDKHLADPLQFPDRHLVDQERATIEALTVAMVARMKSDYLARHPR